MKIWLTRCVSACKAAPWVLGRWEHGDTALMCLGTSQLGYSWILQPSTMPRAYLNFLNYHGGLPLHTYQAVRVRPGSCMHMRSQETGMRAETGRGESRRGRGNT